jgi:Leucine-rich repeat (LRR) protein
LAGLTNLQMIYVGTDRSGRDGVRVTDQTLRSLREIGLLHALPVAEAEGRKRPSQDDIIVALNLREAEVSDAGLKEIAGLKQLQWLFLSYTQVTDEGLKELTGLKNLQVLHLIDTNVTDEGLKNLAGLKNLKAIYLNGTQVSDAGLKELAGLKNLQWLGIGRSKVTAAGVAELQKTLPKCNIQH